jgi:beta-glucosidase
MSAFNEIAGIPSSANRWLLTDVLRREWGFDGFVVSDWTAIDELLRHRIAGTRAGAGIQAISAGVDMDMVSGIYLGELPGMVRAGKLPMATVDEAARRVLRTKFRLGLFDNPFRNCTPGLDRQVILAPAHRELARRLATESIVLLKNEGGVLPLRKELRTLAVIGPLADDSADVLGPWDASGRDSDAVTLLEGIRNAVSKTTRIVRARGCDIASADTSAFAEAVRAAAGADAIVLAAGESRSMSGEAASRSEIGLPGVQHELVRRIVATGKPVILVLMNGRPLTVPWEAEHVPAILEGWYLGIETGNALADVLFGDANPSGKLPVSVPRNLGQIPLYYNAKNTGRPPDPQDKYTSKYLDAPNTPLYPFGYGMSYTSFEYGAVRTSRTTIGIHDTVWISTEVRNTGGVTGDEVVQLYVRDDVATVTRPVQELKGFRRIHLRPGEAREVRFALTADDLAFYDVAMRRAPEPGVFTVYVGRNSVERKETSFELVVD